MSIHVTKEVIDQAKLLFRQGKLQELELHLREAVEHDNTNIELYSWLGQFYLQTRQFKRLINELAVVKNHPTILQLYVSALRAQKQHQYAIELLLAEKSDNHLLLAMLYKEHGDFTSAHQQLDLQLLKSNSDAQAYWQKALLKNGLNKAHVDCLITLLEKKNATQAEQALYAYSVASYFDKQNDYERAFSFYNQGALAKKASFIHYLPAQELDELDQIEAAFSTAIKADHALDSESCPVFIVGMPRTGTTLVEQILASHSQVVGADELSDLAMACQSVLHKVRPNKPYPYWADELPKDAYKAIADSYLTLTSSFQSKRYFTDKMPLNFKAIGIILRAFPNAKIIHCKRNPLDTIWGNYRQLFGDGIRFSYDLKHLANYYLRYNKLMNHWLSLYPTHILNVEYESLVDETEPQIRRMLNFLELDFESKCLDFHRTERVVHTISNEQVKQPIFKSGIGRWRHYEFALNEVINILKKEH